MGKAPSWCELEFFEIVEFGKGGSHSFERVGQREKLIVAEGGCMVSYDDDTVHAPAGANLDLASATGSFAVDDASDGTILIRMCGRWNDETGGSGIFAVSEESEPSDGGDVVPYLKRTDFDSHYHDCDEYWIIYRGRCTVLSEARAYEIGPGDCLATGMGFHHDMPLAGEPVKAVYFETSLQGQKRRGHLWDHTHGLAQPENERMRAGDS